MGHPPVEMEILMSTSIVETKVEILPEITPIPLMQLATSFWAFKTLATAVDMDLFTHLSTSPMNAPETCSPRKNGPSAC